MWQNDVENIHKAMNGMVWNFCCFYYEKNASFLFQTQDHAE